MVLDTIGSSLKKTFEKITGARFVDKKLINEIVKEIQRALLQGDINVSLVMDLSQKIKKRAEEEETPQTITKKEHMVNIVYEELVAFLGKEEHDVSFEKKPLQIMLIGLFGNGKTTTAGKIARYYQSRGRKVAVMQTDTWRPAAYEQLKQLAENIHVDFFGDKIAKKPEDIYKKFKDKCSDYDIVIIDTAGRDALSEELVVELSTLDKAINADERWLVVGADVGQASQKQAEMFQQECKISGIIITKMDGSAKGGGALSACNAAHAPVLFLGVGEGVKDLEKFDPVGFVSRLLGMGDLKGLLEKAKEAFTEDEAVDMAEKMMKGNFNLVDLYQQLESMNKMGSLSKIMDMIPGMGKANIPKDFLEEEEGNIKKWKFIIDSCTQAELEDPGLLTGNRVKRLARGSGTSEQDVRNLLKKFRQSQKMMKKFKPGSKQMKKMMKMMGGGKGMPGLPF